MWQTGREYHKPRRPRELNPEVSIRNPRQLNGDHDDIIIMKRQDHWLGAHIPESNGELISHTKETTGGAYGQFDWAGPRAEPKKTSRNHDVEKGS